MCRRKRFFFPPAGRVFFFLSKDVLFSLPCSTSSTSSLHFGRHVTQATGCLQKAVSASVQPATPREGRWESEFLPAWCCGPSRMPWWWGGLRKRRPAVQLGRRPPTARQCVIMRRLLRSSSLSEMHEPRRWPSTQ